MNTAMPVQHRGLSFGFFIFGAFLLILASITLFRVVPAYIENAQINSIFSTIANDPDMQKASVRNIRNSFERRAAMDAITVIKSDEIDIASGDGRPELSANYSVTIPLFGNVSILMEFNPNSD